MRTSILLVAITATIGLAMGLPGCSAPPDLVGYPVNTPDYYQENKVFFAERLAAEQQNEARRLQLEHIYEVRTDAESGRAGDVIRPNDPISVVLQGVRLPEDLPGGTRDIAVVLTIHTSVERGATELVAFYQRDVPPGQMLNFNNLLVFADPMWDSANPPYFRLKIIDVSAERNRRTSAMLGRLSNISAEIGGMVPHPVIPIVTSAIDAANLVMSNRENRVLLDYQIQFYGQEQVDRAGGATLGPLVAGQWIVLGRARGADASFWEQPLWLDRRTDRIVGAAADDGTGDGGSVPVPYVSVVLLRADAQVPMLVADRSAALIDLLSSPSGKSDVDSIDAAAADLMSAIDAFTVERRLRKYRSLADVEQILVQLQDHESKVRPLNVNEQRRLVYVLDRLTGRGLANQTLADWIAWGADLAAWEIVDDPAAPFGILLRPKADR
jgi:hypothetical protein